MASSFPQESELNLNFRDIIPTRLTSKLRWVLIAAGLVLCFFLLTLARSIYTDLLWFTELGYRSVYIKILVTRIVLFMLGTAIFATAVGISLYCAKRLSDGEEKLPLPQMTRDFLRKFVFWGTIGVVVILSAIFGTILAKNWEIFLKFMNTTSFGLADPVYGKDVSFYLFTLPVYDFIQGWVLGALIVILLASLGMYFVNFSMRGVGFLVTPGLKVHISVVAALIMLVLGLGHLLDRWELLFSDNGVVFGATYADIHARKPALLVLTFVALASGIFILVNGYMRGIRLLVAGVALWIVMSLVLLVVWPNAMQRFTVNPQEYEKEQKYIQRSIEFTRTGFGLEEIVEQPYDPDPVLTAELISQNLETVDNIRLWDHIPLSSVYRQIQLIRPYYDFKDADVDRYMIGGKQRQVMLAAREVAQEKLDEDAQKWVNSKLRYTHGFGIAMSPVTEFTAEGRPEFFAQDIPSDGTIAIQSSTTDGDPEALISNPRIYYGEKTTDYVIVNTKHGELDYQAEGGELKSIHYFGIGGVPIDSLVRRIAYAWQFGDINILITGNITEGSRIQYRREIQERVSIVAPFLTLDGDPYIVAADGGLFWIQDAYTKSDHFPYSDPIDGDSFNYIRNSVKVTIDAFDGTVRLYNVDPEDPLVSTYEKIFPDLFLPVEELPASLASHLRYPQDLFGHQAAKYLRYHMTNPLDFYNLEDLWNIPEEKFGQSGVLQDVKPYYVIMKLPGESTEEFVLLLPYTRNDPPILAGWLAARNDGEAYGQLRAFDFPKDRQVDSPEQVEARIDNDPVISEWFTLRCQEGSECIRGNLLVIPMASKDASSILYAEPIYLQAEGVEFPELKQVILATQKKVVMESSIPKAVAALTGFDTTSVVVKTDIAASSDQTVSLNDNAQVGIKALDTAIKELKKNLSVLEEALQNLKKDLTDGR